MLLTLLLVEDRIQGLADDLLVLGRFAPAWLFGGQPAPLAAWDLEAWPGPLAVEVRDTAGRPALWEEVQEVQLGRARAYQVPPPDVSGVLLGDQHRWADAEPMNSRPGGTYPGSTDLLARHRRRPEVGLVFSMQRPVTKGVTTWIGPGDPEAPGKVARSFSYRGKHRAAAHQQLYGGRLWDAVAVAARGFPQLRAVQVGVAQGWISKDEGLYALESELRLLRFWMSKADNRRFIDPDDVQEIVSTVADQLVRQAVRGSHTPAYPVGRSYLRLLARSTVNRVSAKWSLPAVVPAPVPSANYLRNLRRIELQLARARGVASRTLLTDDQRVLITQEAIDVLTERDRMHELRQSFAERARELGLRVSPEALRQFLARHQSDVPEVLHAAIERYLSERVEKRKTQPPVP